MGLNIHDLHSTHTEFTLGKKVYHIRKFDLLARSWAYDEFKTKEQPDGIHALADRLKKQWHDLPAISKTVYHLLVEKNDFETYPLFLKAIEKDKKNTNLILVDLYNALNKCLQGSEPTESDIGEDAEIKKSTAAAK